jgi:hypothetical protein
MNELPTQRPTGFLIDGTEAPALEPSEQSRVLASDRRRVVLAVLAERSLPLGLEALADLVADREGESETDLRSVRIALHHVHLPLLSDVGVVSYDPETKRLTRGQ